MMLKKMIIKFPIFKSMALKLKNTFLFMKFSKAYLLDQKRYYKFSRTLGINSEQKSIGSIILQYHVIEKGLTIPNMRLSFGKDRIIGLCNACVKHIDEYGIDNEQIKHALSVVFEYETVHLDNNVILDETVTEAISSLKNRTKDDRITCAKSEGNDT